MEPVRIMIARFPYPSQEHPDVADWLIPTVIRAREDDRVKDIIAQKFNDTPITMTRNLAIATAKEKDVDILVMVDSDMSPDVYLHNNPNKVAADPTAKPFWDSSFNFMLEHRANKGPCLIAAPYCGPPFTECVYIFRWCTKQSNAPNESFTLEMYSREDAAQKSGIEVVAALPTGLIMIDMKAIDRIKPPYFYYEWTDEQERKKASTEDVTFTRDLSLAGVPVYCNWDAWAGHWKMKNVGKPIVITSEQVGEKFRDAMNRPSSPEPTEEVQMVQPSPNNDDLSRVMNKHMIPKLLEQRESLKRDKPNLAPMPEDVSTATREPVKIGVRRSPRPAMEEL